MGGARFRLRRLVLAAMALPLAAAGQPRPARRRVALMGFAVMFEGDNGLEAVARELARRGYADGRQVEIARLVVPAVLEEERGRGFEYLKPRIEALVGPAKPDVIVTVGSIMTKAASLVVRDVPIVGSIADPVDMGVAKSLARPGGNVTGVANGARESAVKTMEFMKALVPRLSRVAILHEGEGGRRMAALFAGYYAEAARTLGIEPVMVGAMDPAVLLRELKALPAKRVQAALFSWAAGDPGEMAREALALGLPLVGQNEGLVEAGMLASYSAVQPSFVPAMATTVEQVLRGADPATIPFHFPQQFRFVINRRTANALKLALPADLLLRADRVIE